MRSSHSLTRHLGDATIPFPSTRIAGPGMRPSRWPLFFRTRPEGEALLVRRPTSIATPLSAFTTEHPESPRDAIAVIRRDSRRYSGVRASSLRSEVCVCVVCETSASSFLPDPAYPLSLFVIAFCSFRPAHGVRVKRWFYSRLMRYGNGELSTLTYLFSLFAKRAHGVR